MWLLIFGGLIACTGKLVSSSCQLEITPPSAVVRFKDSFSANCRALSNRTTGMGWESPSGGVGRTEGIFFLPLNIESVTDWDSDPICFSNQPNGVQCYESLLLTVYKMPDSVSVSQPNPQGPMVEGKKYEIQCDIVDVAPARNLSVHWHKGNKIFHTETFNDLSKTPVSKSSVVSVVAHRDDNGTQVWCEAQLNILPAGSNPPSMPSESHEVTVLYPPTLLEPADEIVELQSGSKIILNCTASGNPMPMYSWRFPHPMQETNNNQNTNQPILTPSIQLSGTYNCTASNSQGTTTKRFTVIEPKRNRTTFAALVGGFVTLGVLLFIGGLFFVTPEGTFSFSKGSYLRGQPVSSGPV